MSAQYHCLVGFKSADSDALQLERSTELLRAISHNSDATLIEVLVAADDGRREALVVDFECDDIPNRNPVGLRSPERFAIVVGPDPTKPPSALALRKDFPQVMHLNAVPAGDPSSLCLYFEPNRSAMRSWTAANFLRRIRWWLQSTAEGTLHAADQPVEFPFFDTGWELVLPTDFAELRKRSDLRFFVSFVEPAHWRGSSTMLLRTIERGKAASGGFGFALIDCPPIVHGSRANIPFTLGSLADELSRHGVDLPKVMRDNLHRQIAEDGEAIKGASNRFVILLNIPVCREAGAVTERTQRLALLLAVGHIELGLRLGAYSKFDGKAYKDVTIGGGDVVEGDWRSLKALPAAVLDAPDPSAFRDYSATPTVGPSAAVLVGAGALGSELMNMWTRAGWGTWNIIDSDHLKPHNLARHAAFEGMIGQPKATVCKFLSDSVYGRSGVARAMVGDACDMSDGPLNEALGEADLVVDCTTTLDFPRLAGASERTARHASLFLTPDGNGSVLLLEDARRLQRLRTLEAQYYRAMIQSDWGRDHLRGHLGSFWSGASCRDVSYKLPHSTVLAHASILAEQLIRRYALQSASIQVWIREPQTGATRGVEVPVHAATRWERGRLTVYMDDGLAVKLRQLRAAALPVESGGVLLGYHDRNLGEAVIVDLLPPPPDSLQSERHFERGVDGLLEVYKEVQRRTGNVVGYLGEWHSHPRGYNAQQSTDDLQQLFKLAIGMADDGLPVIQLIVGEEEIELYTGEVVA